MPDVPTLQALSQEAHSNSLLKKLLTQGDIAPVSKAIELMTSVLPKPLHEFALNSLGKAYQTLILKPYEAQIKEKQASYLGYSEEDLASECSTKVSLKATEDFKTIYWLARANNQQSIVDFIETKKNDYPWIFFSASRNAVFAKIAELGDQKNLDKLLELATPEERISMITSGLDGACKGGQINILHNLFEEKCQAEDDKASCQSYLTDNLSRLFRNACASASLDTVEFILQRIPVEQHKETISDFHEGFRYSAISEACHSGNIHVLDRLLKPFTQQEIDSIFLPTPEETKNLPRPLFYANILSFASLEMNRHILATVVSAKCRDAIMTSETYVQSKVKTRSHFSTLFRRQNNDETEKGEEQQHSRKEKPLFK